MRKRLLETIVLGAVGLLTVGSVMGQTLVASDVDNIVYGEPAASYLQANATITNTGSTDIDVLVKFEEVMAGPVGSGHYFCWAVCYNEGSITQGFVTPAQHYVTVPAGSSSTNFYSDYVPHGTVGIATYRYTFYDSSNPSDETSIDITFNTQNVGVEELRAGTNGVSDSYPNPARSVAKVNYSLAQGWRNAEVKVYSMLGSLVKTVALTEDQGTLKLNVASLPAGMYFYTLEVNDQTVATKKMMVTK